MCGRFVAAYDADRLADDWDARVSSSLPPVSWNIAPNTPIRALAPDKRGALWLTAAYWSLIPEWMRNEIPSFPTFNARIETALERPAFRDSARNHRLIVPMTAYYEWDRHKRPYCFTARDKSVLWAAGLFSIRPADRARRLSCTILTRDAVGAAARVAQPRVAKRYGGRVGFGQVLAAVFPSPAAGNVPQQAGGRDASSGGTYGHQQGLRTQGVQAPDDVAVAPRFHAEQEEKQPHKAGDEALHGYPPAFAQQETRQHAVQHKGDDGKHVLLF